jgi:hypothetical protein
MPKSFLEGDLPTLETNAGERTWGGGEAASEKCFLGEVRMTDSEMSCLKSWSPLVGDGCCMMKVDVMYYDDLLHHYTL